MMKRPIREMLFGLLTPHFALAVLLLGTAAVLAGPVASRLRIKLAKEALPLRRPLSTLNEGSLGPYNVVERSVLDPAVVEALGTDQYLDWILEDTSVPSSDPLRYLRLFITYYTGGSGLVPHTPDVCYLGAGYAADRPHANTTVRVPGFDAAYREVPVRLCTFAKTAVFNRDDLSVVYTFFANGRFASTRTGVRLLINNPADTYAFFSKVEVSFPNATRDQCLEGAEKLFRLVLPELLHEHWPDIEAAEATVQG